MGKWLIRVDTQGTAIVFHFHISLILERWSWLPIQACERVGTAGDTSLCRPDCHYSLALAVWTGYERCILGNLCPLKDAAKPICWYSFDQKDNCAGRLFSLYTCDTLFQRKLDALESE